MKHPAAKKPVEVAEQYVDMYASQGWEPVEAKKAESSDSGKGK
jgi:hypothetical protein